MASVVTTPITEPLAAPTVTEPPTLLSTRNPHPRDARIRFVDEGHLYYIDGKLGYTSTTTIVHEWFDPFDADAIIAKMMSSARWSSSKYFGQTAEEIKEGWKRKGEEAARLGTLMHERIEYFYNDDDDAWRTLRGEGGVQEIVPEYAQFQNFNDTLIKQKGYIPYRTEWCVFDHVHKISGSIDMTYQVSADDPDTLVIYDWKRTAALKDRNHFQSGKTPLEHLPDANFWHYALQLNIYRYILETFYGKKVVDMVLVAMHPERDTYEHRPVPRLQQEIKDILKARLDALGNGNED